MCSSEELQYHTMAQLSTILQAQVVPGGQVNAEKAERHQRHRTQ
ncbi:hypothetical protein [Hymenobacter sp. GOD-10R]|nr:hypothetical protein [Hymenobacter sp. GOD-10R]WRQ31733.1 hypothetical protein SD425_28900 [Hymenobacter sp. GOD-10R]